MGVRVRTKKMFYFVVYRLAQEIGSHVAPGLKELNNSVSASRLL